MFRVVKLILLNVVLISMFCSCSAKVDSGPGYKGECWSGSTKIYSGLVGERIYWSNQKLIFKDIETGRKISVRGNCVVEYLLTGKDKP